MRFLFKTTYLQDIRLVKHGGQAFWYGLLVLALLASPWLLSEYWLAQLTFVLIYAVVGLGLMLLSGYTGLFSLGHAAFLGAIFLITMPQVIALAKDVLPAVIGQAPGLQGAVYGFVLIGFVLFEPLGLYGRWLKLRTYLQIFPFYRSGMFKRQKSFLKSDRLK